MGNASSTTASDSDTYGWLALLVGFLFFIIQLFLIALFVYLVVRKAIKDDRASQAKKSAKVVKSGVVLT